MAAADGVGAVEAVVTADDRVPRREMGAFGTGVRPRTGLAVAAGPGTEPPGRLRCRT